MSGRFDYQKAVEGVLARSPEMGKVLDGRADDVVSEAKRLAPRGATGRYADGLEAITGMGDRGLVGRVNARHFTSHWIEFGTIRMRAFAPLRRALETVMGSRNVRGGRDA